MIIACSTSKSSENPKKNLVTTTLCLYDKTWPCGNIKKRKRNVTRDTDVSCSRPSGIKLTEEEGNIARMKFLSNKERAEEEEYGISTELTLPSTDPWIIKTVLTASDLGQLNHLLIHTNPIQDHILRYLTFDDLNKVQEGSGITVNVYDHDTNSTHELYLRRWNRLQSYVLNGGWRMYFVRRRGLREGDEIGLFWDRFASKLHFRVLSRAAL